MLVVEAITAPEVQIHARPSEAGHALGRGHQRRLVNPQPLGKLFKGIGTDDEPTFKPEPRDKTVGEKASRHQRSLRR